MISEDLERLKSADPKTYDVIAESLGFCIAEHEEYVIQGEIQRACQKRGWHYDLAGYVSAHGVDIKKIGKDGYLEDGYLEIIGQGYKNSPAEAFLRAYIQACEAAK